MNTKRILSVIAVTLLTFTAATAQRISVVSENGATSVYRTLQDAIEGADPNSTIYLPGGGFSIADEVKITKKLTIIGIGHKSDNENADGSTIISGNLFFNENSSGSAVMSCYITGNVNIGEGGAAVNDITIKFCNLNSVQVKNSTCQETVVSQNYIRGGIIFSGANGTISNNVISYIRDVNGGIISNNIICGTQYVSYQTYVIIANNSQIDHNIIINPTNLEISGRTSANYVYNVGNCLIYNNMIRGGGDYSDDPINIGSASWNDVFENYNGGAISPVSKFHFKEAYAEYEHQVGIYAGDGFNEDQLAPVPYIVSKSIPQQTDAAGKLNIKIRVKAGE